MSNIHSCLYKKHTTKCVIGPSLKVRRNNSITTTVKKHNATYIWVSDILFVAKSLYRWSLFPHGKCSRPLQRKIAHLLTLNSNASFTNSQRQPLYSYFTKHLITSLLWTFIEAFCTIVIGPSRWLVPLSGMTFLSNCALFHMIFRARFIVSLKPSFLARPELGALLSIYLEGALYKFYR